MKTKEFNLSDKIENGELIISFKGEQILKEFIKRNIGCGIDIGGWNCGDFLEQEQDDEGRWMGQSYYCDRCKKLIKEAGEKLTNEMRIK